MILEYSIEEKDFLEYQLYTASKSDRIKAKRLRNKVVSAIIYIVGGFFLLLLNNYALAITFFILGLLWFFIYPLWERQHYVKHYRSFIRENYKDKLGQPVTLELNNEHIIARDNGSESKVMTKEVVEINETSATFYLKLKGGQSFIIPKDKIKTVDSLTNKLKELANFLTIKYNLDDSWEWK